MTQFAHWFGALCAGVAWTLTSPCEAQTPANAVLHVRGTQPGLTYEMVPRRQRGPGTRCSDPCEVIAPPGKYELRVFGGSQKLGTGSVSVEGSADLRVTPPDVAASQGGLAMGIAGSGLFVGGLIALSIAALSQMCEDQGCGGDHSTAVQLGVVALVGGAVLSPIGWVMFAKNRRPTIEVLPARANSSALASPRDDVTLRLGLAPSLHGGSFAAALTF